MRWLGLVLFCAVITIICAEPDPKKYKPEIKTKEKQISTSLTDDERKFLREVEEKFGIKSEVPAEETKDEDEDADKPPPNVQIKAPFPAVIAIEIVNDTDTKSKGKRTIDANLGYGYRTDNGYTYTYFGKQAQEKGKFMIYPYSQEDIPPAGSNAHNSGYSQKTEISPDVEITPSQAYELVPAKEEQSAYHYDKPAVEFKTNYDNVQGVETPPPPYPASQRPSQQTSSHGTLYTTYNGEQFSGLSGQFPMVMPNYLVDSSQLLKNPQYQNAGLTQDHLRTHGANLEQRVVPVLVLRVPSSYLKNPSAELYANNLPQNYPLSQYLNGVNLQELVNQYFRKIGFSHAPPVMAYQSPALSVPAENPASVSSHSGYEPQQYASPYVQPSYTHADYSGVQYSAVQPVMAKYPSGYTRQQYYMTHGQSLYRQSLQQPQYMYRYSYVPQSPVHQQQQSYYVQPQYQHESYQLAAQQAQTDHVAADQQTSLHDHAEYGSHQQSHSEESDVSSEEYDTPETHNAQAYEQAQQSTPNYGTVTTVAPEYEHSYEESTPEYDRTKLTLSAQHSHDQSVQVQNEQPGQKESVAVYSRGQTGHKFAANPETTQYVYHQKLINENSASDTLVLHENYPSKDHTIATVLPLSYKKQQSPEPVQSVSYVTPVPTMKFHSQYRVMVPQTIFRRPNNEKVTYVNSHSLPTSYSYAGANREINPEQEYTTGSHYIPPIGKQKPSSYPRNYHSSLKRMTKPENKSDTTASSLTKKQMEKSDRKKLS